jgi:trans-aconitate methyltransferase
MTHTWKSTQEHFNRVAQDTESSTYEDRRWKQNARTLQQFNDTQAFIRRYVLPHIQTAKRIMELGPGPGTWTRVLREKNETAGFILTDISGEMLKRARATLPESISVETRESPFLEVHTEKGEVNVFFSSRAVEYVGDTEQAARKIYDTLQEGGFGCIITKTPKTIENKLRGHTPSELHRNQIAPKKLVAALRAVGFTNINIHPVTFSFPLLKSATADRVVSALFSKHKLNPLSQFFTESYAATFTKTTTSI